MKTKIIDGVTGEEYGVSLYEPSRIIFRHDPKELSQVKNLVKTCEKDSGRLNEVHKSHLKEHIRDHIENELDELYLAKKPDGRLIATTGYKIAELDNAPGISVFARDFNYVHPDFRRRGLGRQLDNILQEIQLGMGRFNGIFVSTIAGDSETSKFLEKVGYQKIEPHLYFRPNNQESQSRLTK